MSSEHVTNSYRVTALEMAAKADWFDRLLELSGASDFDGLCKRLTATCQGPAPAPPDPKPVPSGRKVTIYTDGGFDPVSRRGGWGVVILNEKGELVHQFTGSERNTSNNKMELQAAISALQYLEDGCSVTLHSDSQYLCRGMTEWVDGWVRRGWKKPDKKTVLNQSLWEALLVQRDRHQVEWKWVRGHDGDRWNEVVDQMATEAMTG